MCLPVDLSRRPKRLGAGVALDWRLLYGATTRNVTGLGNPGGVRYLMTIV
jgi:hypothetical protein